MTQRSMPGTLHEESESDIAESTDDRFQRILDVYGSALMRLTYSYARDSHDAEDLYQDICLALWQALSRFRGDSSERTFVYRVAHNRGITHRSRRKPPAVPLEEAGPLIDAGEPVDVRHQRIQRINVLMQAIRQLPDIQRQIVVLSLEGLPQKEIAEVVGLTENNIAVRLNRARNALKLILEEKGEDGWMNHSIRNGRHWSKIGRQSRSIRRTFPPRISRKRRRASASVS